MNAKKTVLFLFLMLAAAFGLRAQQTSDDYQRRFNNLVDRLGYGGIGFETLFDQWEKALPEDPYLYQARFVWCFNRARSVSYVQLDADRYLGREPILPFVDSLGQRRNYFEDISYDPDLFALAQDAVVKAIQLMPTELELRLAKISALMGYERESPDMASAELCGLIDYNFISKPAWTWGGETVSEEAFLARVQEYCYQFYRLGTTPGSEAFRMASERVLKYRPGQPLFMDNLGSYYLVFKKDPKTALKYYNKVLKAHPDDETAIRNCIILARNEKNVKLEKKYLSMMVRYGHDETARETARLRLESLQGKK